MATQIQHAFDTYFKKLEVLYEKLFSSKPTAAYTDTLNKALLLSEPDGDGEVQWEPVRQTAAAAWSGIEAALGFPVCQELKEYYTTYYFLSLAGSFGSSDLYFYRIDGSKPLEDIVMLHYRDAQHVFPGSQCFLIGNAVVNDDDGYFIYFDNETGKLFCHESDTQNRVLLSYSLAKTIEGMEAGI